MKQFHGEVDPVYLIGALEVIKIEIMMQDLSADELPTRLDS